MNLSRQHSSTRQPRDRGIVLGEAGSGSKHESRRRRNEASVQVENILDAAGIRGLVDEWLVPALVDGLIRELRDSSLDGER
jgi:hypothetical protein